MKHNQAAGETCCSGEQTPRSIPSPLLFIAVDFVLIEKLPGENVEGCGFFLFFPQRTGRA